MSIPVSPDGPAAVRGALAGAVAYVFGVALVVGSVAAGLNPTVGVFERLSGGAGYLLLHQAAHLPVWDGAVQWALLPYTVVLAVLLVIAGVTVGSPGADRIETSFQTGRTITVGYFSSALVGSVAFLFTHGAVTAIRMVAPTVLVGICFPLLFAGLGGVMGTQYRGHTK